jgi:DNA polymerase-3 subunit delta
MADELKPAYLIAGTDRPKIDRAVERLRRRFGLDAVEIYHASELTGADAVAACNALGLFAGEGRLIVVERVEEWKAPDAKEVADYLRSPAPATTLALVGGEVKKDAPLAKAVSGAKGELLLWDVPQKALQRWISEQFGLHGTKAEPEACRTLLELVGDDVYDLSSEIDKISTWAAGDPVTAGDVERLVAARAETTNFALTDAWGARDVESVLHRPGLFERLASCARPGRSRGSSASSPATRERAPRRAFDAREWRKDGRHDQAPLTTSEALRTGQN